MPLPANMYNYYSVATEVSISAYMGCDTGLFRHYQKKRGKAFTEQQINGRWIYLKGSAMTLFICDGTRELIHMRWDKGTYRGLHKNCSSPKATTSGIIM
jgi:hypothetical protein